MSQMTVQCENDQTYTLKTYPGKGGALYVHAREVANMMGVPWNTFRTKMRKLEEASAQFKRTLSAIDAGITRATKKKVPLGTYLTIGNLRALCLRNHTKGAGAFAPNFLVKAIFKTPPVVQDTTISNHDVPARKCEQRVAAYNAATRMSLRIVNTVDDFVTSPDVDVTDGVLPCTTDLAALLHNADPHKLGHVVRQEIENGVLVEGAHYRRNPGKNSRIRLTAVGFRALTRNRAFRRVIGPLEIAISVS